MSQCYKYFFNCSMCFTCNDSYTCTTYMPCQLGFVQHLQFHKDFISTNTVFLTSMHTVKLENLLFLLRWRSVYLGMHHVLNKYFKWTNTSELHYWYLYIYLTSIGFYLLLPPHLTIQLRQFCHFWQCAFKYNKTIKQNFHCTVCAEFSQEPLFLVV